MGYLGNSWQWSKYIQLFILSGNWSQVHLAYWFCAIRDLMSWLLPSSLTVPQSWRKCIIGEMDIGEWQWWASSHDLSLPSGDIRQVMSQLWTFLKAARHAVWMTWCFESCCYFVKFRWSSHLQSICRSLVPGWLPKDSCPLANCCIDKGECEGAWYRR